jgi:hypothetical protein
MLALSPTIAASMLLSLRENPHKNPSSGKRIIFPNPPSPILTRVIPYSPISLSLVLLAGWFYSVSK